MIKYYTDFYKRDKKADHSRRNTKELHGKYLSTLLPHNSTILEIGAADGITAEYLARHEYKVYVYEPSKQFSKQLKQSSHLTYIDDHTSFSGTFDAIYLHHVLEHIPKPIQYIRTLRSLLKEKGVLLVQVPDLSLQLSLLDRMCRRKIYTLFNRPYFDFKMFNCEMHNNEATKWFDALANDHINAFTREGIEYIMKESNYHVETIIQSTEDRITYNNINYAWPVDEETGNTPNGLTIIARK